MVLTLMLQGGRHYHHVGYDYDVEYDDYNDGDDDEEEISGLSIC